MSQPTITLDNDQDSGVVTLRYGGPEGTQRRAAVLGDHDTVATVALVPADWAEQDPTTRWQPSGTVVLLEDDDARVGPGWRRQGGSWSEPTPAPAPEPAPVADGTIDYGEVDAVGPPILVTITRTEQQVEAGRLAGYTPENGHMVKLTRISGQWVVEDRVLLPDA